MYHGEWEQRRANRIFPNNIAVSFAQIKQSAERRPIRNCYPTKSDKNMTITTGNLKDITRTLSSSLISTGDTDEARYVRICIPWIRVLLSTYSLARQGEVPQARRLQARLIKVLLQASMHEPVPHNLRSLHMLIMRSLASLVQTLRTLHKGTDQSEPHFRNTAECVSELGRHAEMLREWEVISQMEYSHLILPSTTSGDSKESWPAFLYSPPRKTQ